MAVDKPYAESCAENRWPILEVLKSRLRPGCHLLEIGSGTGQHAVYFVPELDNVTWQTSDRMENLPGIRAWLADLPTGRLPDPVLLDVLTCEPPADAYDAVFSANTAHILHQEGVVAMFAIVGKVLRDDGRFLLYGPFNYDGQYTSASNARFDQWLQTRDPLSGIRDLAWLRGIAAEHGLTLEEDIAMPANNRTLVWLKK